MSVAPRAFVGPRVPRSALPALMLTCCVGALAATCALYWTLGGRAFADFAVYADVAQELGARDAELRVFGPEGLSRGLLQFFQHLFLDGDRAAQATALVCQGLVAAAVALVARRRGVRPENLLLAIALYAPLLALITLRATPAYLVCAAAVGHARLAVRPRLGWVMLAGIGSLLFHLSAAFVVAGAVGAALIPQRTPRVAWFGVAAAAGAAALAFRQSLDVGTVLAFAGGATVLADPLLAERLAYFTEAAAPVSAAHLVYFAFVTALVIRVVFMGPPHPSDRLVLTLYVLYAVCLVSPVIAFRNSYYVLLPLVVTAPRPVLPFGSGVLGQALHVIACTSLLAFSIYGVLYRG